MRLILITYNMAGLSHRDFVNNTEFQENIKSIKITGDESVLVAVATQEEAARSSMANYVKQQLQYKVNQSDAKKQALPTFTPVQQKSHLVYTKGLYKTSIAVFGINVDRIDCDFDQFISRRNSNKGAVIAKTKVYSKNDQEHIFKTASLHADSHSASARAEEIEAMLSKWSFPSIECIADLLELAACPMIIMGDYNTRYKITDKKNDQYISPLSERDYHKSDQSRQIGDFSLLAGLPYAEMHHNEFNKTTYRKLGNKKSKRQGFKEEGALDNIIHIKNPQLPITGRAEILVDHMRSSISSESDSESASNSTSYKRSDHAALISDINVTNTESVRNLQVLLENLTKAVFNNFQPKAIEEKNNDEKHKDQSFFSSNLFDEQCQAYHKADINRRAILSRCLLSNYTFLQQLHSLKSLAIVMAKDKQTSSHGMELHNSICTFTEKLGYALSAQQFANTDRIVQYIANNDGLSESFSNVISSCQHPWGTGSSYALRRVSQFFANVFLGISYITIIPLVFSLFRYDHLWFNNKKHPQVKAYSIAHQIHASISAKNQDRMIHSTTSQFDSISVTDDEKMQQRHNVELAQPVTMIYQASQATNNEQQLDNTVDFKEFRDEVRIACNSFNQDNDQKEDAKLVTESTQALYIAAQALSTDSSQKKSLFLQGNYVLKSHKRKVNKSNHELKLSTQRLNIPSASIDTIYQFDIFEERNESKACKADTQGQKVFDLTIIDHNHNSRHTKDYDITLNAAENANTDVIRQMFATFLRCKAWVNKPLIITGVSKEHHKLLKQLLTHENHHQILIKRGFLTHPIEINGEKIEIRQSAMRTRSSPT